MTQRIQYITVFFFALAAFGLRLYGIEAESIWMDEDMQARHAHRHPLHPKMVTHAAKQQQPPIDYVFEAIAFQNFGLTTFGARITAAVMGTLTALLLLVIAIRLSPHLLVRIGAGTMALLHPMLIRFSQEGRPVATATLFATIHLYLIIQAIEQPKQVRKAGFVFALFTSELVLLWSIGFQPVVFLLVSGLSLMPLLFQQKSRLSVGIVYSSMALAVLLALPVLKVTIQNGGRYLKETSITAMVGLLSVGIPKVSSESVTDPYFSFFQNAHFPILIIATVGVFLAIWHRNRLQISKKAVITYLALFTALFPLLFTILFQSFISYRITVRYFLIFFPVALLFITVLLHQTIEFASQIESQKKARAVQIAAALLIASIGIVFAHRTVTHIYQHQENAGWREMYAFLEKPEHNGGRAYMMNLVPPKKFRPYFFGRQFYYRKRPVALSRIDKLPKHYKSSRVLKNVPYVFLVTMYGCKYIVQDDFENLPFVSVHRFGPLSVLRIQPNQTIKEAVLTVFRQLSQKVRLKQSTYKVHEILFKLETASHRKRRADKALAKLQRLNENGKLTSVIKKLKAAK